MWRPEVCGLCNHPAHPADRCAEVYVIRAGHSAAVVERIPCPCWVATPRRFKSPVIKAAATGHSEHRSRTRTRSTTGARTDGARRVMP